jgi:hypothetical protein
MERHNKHGGKDGQREHTYANICIFIYVQRPEELCPGLRSAGQQWKCDPR